MTDPAYDAGDDASVLLRTTCAIDSALAACGLLVNDKTDPKIKAVYYPFVSVLTEILEPSMQTPPTAAADTPAASCDLLEQAAAIARSAAGDVDWTREPLTKREAEIRRRWLQIRLDDQRGRWSLGMMATMYRLERKTMASDIATAAHEADVLDAIERAEHDRGEFEEIGEMIDDEAA